MMIFSTASWRPALAVALTLAAFLAPAALPAHAADERPSEILAHYKVYRGGLLIGTVEERFTREGDNYRIVSETETAGVVKLLLRERLTMRATGKVGAGGLESARYEFRRTGYPAKDVTATFDRARRQIVSQHGGKVESFELPPGTLDRISAMYQFAFRAPSQDEVSVWMSQGKDAQQYKYRKEGEPVLRLEGIDYPTLHFKRESAPGRSQAQMWLAKNRHFLPVKVLFEDSKGTVLEQTLVDLTVQ